MNFEGSLTAFLLSSWFCGDLKDGTFKLTDGDIYGSWSPCNYGVSSFKDYFLLVKKFLKLDFYLTGSSFSKLLVFICKFGNAVLF